MKSKLKMNKMYLLDSKNYYQTEYTKSQIVIGNTFSSGLNHITRWKTRLNGNYKATAPFTITRDGTIYNHYDPKHHSDFIGIREIDRQIIPIVLENEGWLVKDFENDTLINWVGDIYNGEVVVSRWRNHVYWAGYSNQQIDSLVKLCKLLCNDFNIPLTTLTHNTKTNVENHEGIAYRSNYNQYFSDITPAFDINEFKNKLELN